MYATHQTHENEMSPAHSRMPNSSLEMKPNLSFRPPVSIFHDVRVAYNAAPPQKRQPLQLITDEEAKAILINHLLTFLNLSPGMGDRGNILFTAIRRCLSPERQAKPISDLDGLGVQGALEKLELSELTSIKDFILSKKIDPQDVYGLFNFTLNASFSKNFTANHFAPNPAAALELSKGRFSDPVTPITVSTVLLSSQRNNFFMNENEVLTQAKETQTEVTTINSYYYWEFRKDTPNSPDQTPPIYHSPIILKVNTRGQIYHLQGTAQHEKTILPKEKTPIPAVILEQMQNLHTLINQIDSFVKYDILTGINGQLSAMDFYFSEFFSRKNLTWDENKLADTYGLLIQRFLFVLSELIDGKDPTEKIKTRFELLRELLSRLSSTISDPMLVSYFELLHRQALWNDVKNICEKILSQLTPQADSPDSSTTGLSLSDIIKKYSHLASDPYEIGRQIVCGDIEAEYEGKRLEKDLACIAEALSTTQKGQSITQDDYRDQLIDGYNEAYKECFPQ